MLATCAPRLSRVAIPSRWAPSSRSCVAWVQPGSRAGFEVDAFPDEDFEGVVTYHDSCHARRELHASSAAKRLLERIEGLEVRPLLFEDECCGFGGTFAAKQPEVSVAMMTSKLDDIALTGARVVCSTDYSCLAHIEGGARGIGIQVQGWSLAELLSRALA